MPSAERSQSKAGTGLPARRAALQMLDAVLRRGRTLDAAGAAERTLSPADHGLAVAIAGEVLRRLPDFDTLIDGAMRKPLPQDSKARMVLRIALAQKIGLGTPDFAIVATALPLVDGGPRRLVHGVLGTLLRRGLPPLDAPRLPDEVEQRWNQAWGASSIAAARRLIAARPPLDLSFARDADARAFAAETGGRSLAPRHVRLWDAGNVADLPGFEDGSWWVQDLAASIPARLVGDSQGEAIDLCAAPGGKTMQMAAAGWRVTALDRSESRLARLGDNLARTGHEARLIAADALDWSPQGPVDAVLLDAPCSATGTFRRHPEVLYRVRPRIIADSAALQARLIRRAAAFVRPSGVLVYAVCSLEPQEGEEIVRAFLAEDESFRITPPEAGDGLPDAMTPAAEGWLRILPEMLEDVGGVDGFFVARLVRSA